MLPISLRYESDDGHIVEFVPTHATPLACADLRLLDDHDDAVLQVNLGTNKISIDGEVHQREVGVKMNVTFRESVTVYALVPGGWLPMPFAKPANFLVDRNVVIALRKLREGKLPANGKALQWWTSFFVEGGGLFNLLLYAFEAGFRRKPSLTEFIAAYEEGASELAMALPGSKVVRLDDAVYRVAYAQLEAFDRQWERESQFLQVVCPIVAQRAAQGSESRMVAQIVSSADSFGVERASLVVLAVLSCLFEHARGGHLSIGRLVLKPKTTFSEADAFNAISDIRHIELVVANQGIFGEEAFSLCTCDRGLALMWSALSPRMTSPKSHNMDFTFDLTSEMFERLDDNGLRDLKDLLAA